MMTYAFSLYDPMHPKTKELYSKLMKNAAKGKSQYHLCVFYFQSDFSITTHPLA